MTSLRMHHLHSGGSLHSAPTEPEPPSAQLNEGSAGLAVLERLHYNF